MALAFLSDPCLPQHTPWATFDPQCRDSAPWASLDFDSQCRDLTSGSPLAPALLPFGAINRWQLGDIPGEMLGLSTPVMHPKLVDTIKSVISPSPSSSSDHSGGWTGGGGMFSEASSDELRTYDDLRNHGGGIRRCGGKRKQALLMQQHLPEMYSLSPLSSPDQFYTSHFATGGAEDDEAAVVPVDLIQNRRPFKCAYAGCSKTFKNPQTMKMHHKTHYSEDAAYRLNPDVNAHVMSTFRAGHNKKIPSRCPTCRKTFVGLYELRRHYGRKHTVGEKKFGCKKCGKKFYIEVDLRDHEKLCGEPIECKCGMKFAFKCNLVAHKKGHPECQDPPTEVEQNKIGTPSQQQSRSSRRNASSSASIRPPVTGTSPVAYCNMSSMSSSPPLPHLTSVWSPMSHSSEDFSPLPSLPTQDVMTLSPDSSYPPVTSADPDYAVLSRDPSAILLSPNFAML